MHVVSLNLALKRTAELVALAVLTGCRKHCAYQDEHAPWASLIDHRHPAALSTLALVPELGFSSVQEQSLACAFKFSFCRFEYIVRSIYLFSVTAFNENTFDLTLTTRVLQSHKSQVRTTAGLQTR